jgi:replicative DNA helicase
MGGAREMHRQNEVSEFLAELTEIAEAVGCAVVAIAHLNKQSDQHPLHRIIGSVGFVASIRSALFFGINPDDNNRRALAHGKSHAAIRERQSHSRLLAAVAMTCARAMPRWL